MSDMPDRQLPLLPIDGENPLTRHSRLVEALGPFEDHLRREGRSPHTISAFRSDLRLLCSFFGDDMLLNAVTTTQLNRFMNWIEHGRDVPCSRKSYARRVTTLKVFFKYLKSEGVLPDDPASALLQRSGAAPLQPILADEDVKRLLAYVAALRLAANKPDARPEVLLRLLLDTGIKKGECMALTPQSVIRDNPLEPLLVVRHKKPNNIYKERKIALGPEWPDLLDEYLAQYTPEDVIFDCTPRNLEYVLRDVAKGAGVEAKVSFEILRWTCAVRDYRSGMDLDDLREKMGLSRISWRETSDKIVRLAALQEDRERS
ncbi:MAG: site-specific integrase [Chloroflexi bacterium]|nr:site-specific integrase [Chloroflexota bacterium]